MIKTIFFLISAYIVVLIFSVDVRIARAVVGSCTTSVTPESVQPSVSGIDFQITATNTGETDIRWYRFTKPFSGLTVTSMALPGWTKTYTPTGTDIVLTGTQSPSGSLTLNFSVDVGDIAGSSGNWVIEASDDSGGSSPTTCSGSVGLTVSGSAPDTTAPIISGISVSSTTSSSAVVSWTTDEAATSKVKYDVNADYDTYPFSHEDTTNTTNHSVTVTSSLAASTTYYYKVCSTDASGNEACSDEAEFTTTAVGAPTSTPVPTSASTTTSTSTAATKTPTPTPKPVDKTAPSVALLTDFSKPFKESPLISGKASDTGAVNVGVAKVEYSTDNGKNWLPVDEIKGTVSAEFSFLPLGLEDGNYEVKVRAKDSTGNIGYSAARTMVIDRLPPQVGGMLVSIGPQPLLPSPEGIIFALAGLAQKITLSAVGGPLEIKIKSSTVSRQSSVQESFLTKNPDNGLWSGELSFPDPGVYQLLAKSIDGAKNQTERVLNTVLVMGNGQVTSEGKQIKDALVSVYYFDSTTQRFVLWDGRPYGQVNPQKTDGEGAYKLLLPAGKYYLQVQAFGYKSLKTDIFTLEKTLPVNMELKLEKGKQIVLGPWIINLPSWEYSQVPLVLNISTIPDSLKTESVLLGKEVPNFNLVSEGKTLSSSFLKGKPMIATFLNTWSPFASEQLSILTELSGKTEIAMAVFLPQESISSVSIFQKRGGYVLPLIADPDGTLVEPLNLQSIPTHLFLNRKGVVQKVKSGVLSKEEILDNLVN